MKKRSSSTHQVALLPTLTCALLPALLCACASVLPGPSSLPSPPPTAVPTAVPAAAPTAAPTAAATDASTAPPADAAPAADTASESTEQLLQTTRSTARSTAEWIARSVDSWFGDRPFEQGGKVSDGRLSLSLFKRGDARADVDVRFNARFRLPNIEHKAYLFVGRDDQRGVIRDTPESLQRLQLERADRPDERTFLGGLGLSVLDALDFRLGLSSRLKPYVQARYEKPWEVAPEQQIEFRETVFWTSAERFGATTALSYRLGLSPILALRWFNVATITQESRNVEWSSTVGAYRTLGWQRQVALEFIVSGTGTRGTGVGASDYGVLLKWEQPLYQNWLFGEVVGGHFWPRADAQSVRGRAWAAGGSLRLRF